MAKNASSSSSGGEEVIREKMNGSAAASASAEGMIGGGPRISFPPSFSLDGAEKFADDDDDDADADDANCTTTISPVSITTVTGVSPSGDKTRTTMATKTSRTCRTLDENGRRVTQKKVQRIVMGQHQIVSPVRTFANTSTTTTTMTGGLAGMPWSGDGPAAGGGLLIDPLLQRKASQLSSPAALSVISTTANNSSSSNLPNRPMSYYGGVGLTAAATGGRCLPNSDPELTGHHHFTMSGGDFVLTDDNDPGTGLGASEPHTLDELDMAIEETLQKTMDIFQQMIEKEREQLLRLFPQLANSRIALADQAPATEVITERRVEPDGTVVEVERVITRQIVRVHKSVSMVNGIVKAAAARAIVEYQGPNGGYRVKLEDSDAAVDEVNSETEEDDDATADRTSIAPSEFDDATSVIAMPGKRSTAVTTTIIGNNRKKPSSTSNALVAVRTRTGGVGGDVVPSLQTSPKRKSEKAWYAALELVESERRYVEKLRLMDQVFRTRVQQDPETAKSIGDDKLKKLFINIGQLYSFHNDHLLPQLEARLEEWPTAQKICNVVRRLAPFLKIYSEYTSNYRKAVKTFEELRKRSRRFASIIDQIEKLPECDHLPLSNHIICPIQRVTRYHLLMTEYLKNLYDDHPDMEDTTQALALTKEAAAHANNMMRQLDKYKNVIEVQELLGSQIHELLTPSRELIKQGQLTKISSRTGEHQQRYVFLFNDMLLLCSARRNVVWGNKYKLRAIFEVGSMHVLEGDNLEVENTFYVRSGNKTVELYTASAKEKSEWMETLWSLIQDHHKRMKSFRKRDTIIHISTDAGVSSESSSPAKVLDQQQQQQQQTPQKSSSQKQQNSSTAAGRCPICSATFKTFRKPRACNSCGQNFCKKCCQKVKSPTDTVNNKDQQQQQQRLCSNCSAEKAKSHTTPTPGELDAAPATSPTPSSVDSPERHGGSTSPVSSAGAGATAGCVEPVDAGSTQRIRRKSMLEVKPTDSCILSGKLQFRLATRKWEERYFALHEDFVLYTFKCEKDASARTSMPITGCQVSLVDHRLDPTIGNKEGNVFKIGQKRRTYYLKAESAQEMAKWVAALDLASQALFPKLEA